MTTINCVLFHPDEARALNGRHPSAVHDVEAKVVARLTLPEVAKTAWTMTFPDGAARYWEPGTTFPDDVTDICCIAYTARIAS